MVVLVELGAGASVLLQPHCVDYLGESNSLSVPLPPPSLRFPVAQEALFKIYKLASAVSNMLMSERLNTTVCFCRQYWMAPAIVHSMEIRKRGMRMYCSIRCTLDLPCAAWICKSIQMPVSIFF